MYPLVLVSPTLSPSSSAPPKPTATASPEALVTTMSTSLPKSLRILFDTGIIRTARATESRTDTETSAQVGEPTGSLGAGVPPSSSVIAAAPKQQPSLFWKAIGFCLKNSLTNSGSLHDDGRALFLAEPGQTGIPAGVACPTEVTNYQVFINTDTMQQVNRLTFSLSGSSYFEFLNLYLKHVGETNESKELVQARQALLQAKAKKDQIWEANRAAYVKQSANAHSPLSLIKYMKDDEKYNSASVAESDAESAFVQLRDPAMASVSGQLDLLRLADMRLEPQVGNNMPVIAVDSDWIEMLKRDPQATKKSIVDPKNIYYRPQHALPQYESTTDYWIKSGASASTLRRVGPYTIPLAGVWDRSWSDLGHPLLDRAKPQEALTDEQKQFISSLTATLTFLQSPYTGNVSRGMWDINDPRDRFRLQPNAPRSVKDTVCKTSKLILAWGLEIELTIPEVVPSAALKNITLAAMNLPLKTVAGDSNKMVFKGGADGFPILVGALADMV